MNILFPKYLTFGADIESIEFKDHFVTKKFKNLSSYSKTINFYKYVKHEDQPLFPKLFSSNIKILTIVTENCGNLLNTYNLPDNWEVQINNFRNFFLKNKFLILDMRFMPHTPYVINNMCIRDNKIYLVDLALYENSNEYTINKYFDNFIYNIKLRLKYRNNTFTLFTVHIYLEIKRLLTDLYIKIINCI